MFNFHLHYIFSNMTLTRLLICSGYLFNAIVWCLLISRSKDVILDDQIILSRMLWLSIAIVFILMAINSIFNIDIRLTEAFRKIAKTKGWYDQRYPIQLFFVAGITAIGIIFSILIVPKITDGMSYHRLILLMVVFLAAFIILRAISCHPVDQILNRQIGRYRIGSILESGCISFIGVLLLVNSLYLAKNRGRNKLTSTIRYI
jgi:hypothetical protein